MGGRGVKKIPFFWFIKKGTYSYEGRGQKLFPMFNFVFLSPHNLWQFLMPCIVKIVYISMCLFCLSHSGKGGRW